MPTTLETPPPTAAPSAQEAAPEGRLQIHGWFVISMKNDWKRIFAFED